jgi:hypothetical protein
MKWKRNSCLLGKHFFFDDGGSGRAGYIHYSLTSPPFFVSPCTKFPFPSLPPCLDAIWKQATFRDTPLGRKRIRRWLSRLAGSFSGHRARRVVEAPPGGHGRRGRPDQKGHDIQQEGRGALKRRQAVDDVVVGTAVYVRKYTILQSLGGPSCCEYAACVLCSG